GWIIPAPLAIPPTVIIPAGVSIRTAQCFGRVSVVMMARAASGPPSGVSPAAAVRRPSAICATGRGTPITPVDNTSAVRGVRPACTAAAVKPRGEVTEPFGISDVAEDIGGEDSPRPSLVKPPGVSYHSTTFPGGPFDVGTVPELRRLRRTCTSTLQRSTIR